uniref:Uncharacterized protein n=1 Tax=Arundo donax TaxID=35708 RepID=A0A0A9GE12_ARUDO
MYKLEFSFWYLQCSVSTTLASAILYRFFFEDFVLYALYGTPCPTDRFHCTSCP